MSVFFKMPVQSEGSEDTGNMQSYKRQEILIFPAFL